MRKLANGKTMAAVTTLTRDGAPLSRVMRVRPMTMVIYVNAILGSQTAGQVEWLSPRSTRSFIHARTAVISVGPSESSVLAMLGLA
jgi:hypothetical protein